MKVSRFLFALPFAAGLATLIQGSPDSPVGPVHAAEPARQRSELPWGLEGSFGAPHGMGMHLKYQLTRVSPALELGAGVATSVATVSAVVDASVRARELWNGSSAVSGWSPVLTLQGSYLRTTGILERIVRSNGLYLNVSGIGVFSAGVLAGVGFQSESGLHIQVSAGRLWQLGSSGFGGREGVILSGWSSVTGGVAVGKRF